MTAFATADDFAARIGLTLTTDEQTRATTLLTLASDLIRLETKQTIDLVTNDALTIRSTYSERLRLPERPVVSVASVTLTPQGGTATTIGSDTYYLEGDELVRSAFPLRYQQFFANWTRGWLGPLWTLTVTYTHGFATIPAVVKATTLEMVVRVWANPNSVARETVAGVSTVFDNMRYSPTGLLMTDAEKAAVNDVIRRNSGSITLR